MKIFLINTLDKRYGSTVRARNFRTILKNAGHVILYTESNFNNPDSRLNVSQKDSITGWIAAALKRALMVFSLDYDLLFLMKVSPVHLPSIIIARFRGKKIWIDWDDMDSEFQASRFRQVIFSYFESRIPRFANLITTHSRYILQHVKKQFPGSETATLPQTIDTDLFSLTGYEKEILRAEMQIPDLDVIGYLCTFTVGGMRDFDCATQIVAEIIKSGKDVLFLVIGGGPEQNTAEKMIEQSGITNYRITGYLEHEKIPPLLAILDLALIYMRNDLGNRMRVSLKLLEYLSMGIPVVGHVVGESADIFHEYYFEEGENISHIAKIVLELLDSNEKFKTDAIEFIRKNYSNNSTTETLKQLLPPDNRKQK